MFHKHVKSLTALICAILTLGLCSAAHSSDVEHFHKAIAQVNQPYKSALFYLRTGNAGVASLELSAASTAWGKVVEKFGMTPPGPLADDPGWQTTMDNVSTVLESGEKLAAEGKSAQAREALLPIRAHLHKMRKRNGLRVMADCVYDLNAYMDVLYFWRKNPADFKNADVREKAKSASLNYINQLKLCRSEAPQNLTADADFKSVMDGAAKSASSLLKPIADQRPDAFINVLRELKSFDVIIFVRWG